MEIGDDKGTGAAIQIIITEPVSQTELQSIIRKPIVCNKYN